MALVNAIIENVQCVYALSTLHPPPHPGFFFFNSYHHHDLFLMLPFISHHYIIMEFQAWGRGALLKFVEERRKAPCRSKWMKHVKFISWFFLPLLLLFPPLSSPSSSPSISFYIFCSFFCHYTTFFSFFFIFWCVFIAITLLHELHGKSLWIKWSSIP